MTARSACSSRSPRSSGWRRAVRGSRSRSRWSRSRTRRAPASAPPSSAAPAWRAASTRRGSRAATATASTMGDALRAYGGDPGALAGRPPRQPTALIGYVEVHIEQGPVLERAGTAARRGGGDRGADALGRRASRARPATRARSRWTRRRDALCAAAELVLEVEAVGSDTARARRDRGRAGRAAGGRERDPRAGAAQRSTSATRDDAAPPRGDSHAGGERAERDRGGAPRSSSPWDAAASTTAPCAATPELTAVARARPFARGGRRAAAAAERRRARCACCSPRIAPVAMLFVRCAGGVSHDPAESVAEEDVAVALDVLDELLAGLAGERTPA